MLGKLTSIRTWYDRVKQRGPAYGYFLNDKTKLIVKAPFLNKAKELFADEKIEISAEGARDLGAAIGSAHFLQSHVRDKVAKWNAQVESLANIAKTQPHAAHAVFTLGLRNKWTHVQRTMKHTEAEFQPLEDTVRNLLLPALFGDKAPLSDQDRALYALPPKFAGLGISQPVSDSGFANLDSWQYSSLLQDNILSGDPTFAVDPEAFEEIKKTIKQRRIERRTEDLKILTAVMTPDALKVVELARDPGSSSLYTAMPLARHGCIFRSKLDWRDLTSMRYRKLPKDIAPTCACGKPFSLDHSQICKVGGFIHLRHNDVSQLWAHLCRKIWRDVQVEPTLQALSGEVLDLKSANRSPEARSDVRVRSFWRRYQNAFFDFRVFYPFASSYRSSKVSSLYKSFENAKKREYKQRIDEVEAAEFVPMVMSTSGGMGEAMVKALRRLASALADKTGETYSQLMGVLRCRFAFAMMRSALVCLRGTRSRVSNSNITYSNSWDMSSDMVSRELF